MSYKHKRTCQPRRPCRSILPEQYQYAYAYNDHINLKDCVNLEDHANLEDHVSL